MLVSSRDQEIRKARAEAASSAGVGYGRASLEVLYLLPEQFLDAYVKLFHKALKEDSSSPLGGQQRKAELGRATGKGGSELAKRRLAKAQKGATLGGYFTVKDERAFAEKRRIDKRLRALAREIGVPKEERDKKNIRHRVRCKDEEGVETNGREEDKTNGGCGRWIEREWWYCPWCGDRKR